MLGPAGKSDAGRCRVGRKRLGNSGESRREPSQAEVAATRLARREREGVKEKSGVRRDRTLGRISRRECCGPQKY